MTGPTGPKPCSLQPGLLLTGGCPTCNHFVLAHRMDKVCTVCALYEEVMAERFPERREVQSEARRPVADAPKRWT